MARNRLTLKLAAGLSVLLQVPVQQLLRMPEDKLRAMLRRLGPEALPQTLLTALAALFGGSAWQSPLPYQQKPGQGKRDKEAITQERVSVKEERLEEEQLRKTFPLKNGGLIEAGQGLNELSALRVLLEEEPYHFQTLLAIARGEAEALDPESIAHLNREGYLSKDARIDKDLRDVLLSSYQETPVEGPVLVTPFKLSDASEALVLERGEEQRHQRRVQEIRERLKRERDGPST